MISKHDCVLKGK